MMSCDRKPYVEHKVKEEKVADDCKERQSYFRKISNFGGERYEFEKCLHPEFNGGNEVISWRKSDTVFVAFKSPNSASDDKVFHITLDIDSYPEYHYIWIDGDTYSTSPTENNTE
ncbi:MAG TPA: hypothetical protein VFT15_03200 [Chitinophagaceae bacterium]|nr:hypothetical protein [Chitinophagaceae bacterium]